MEWRESGEENGEDLLQLLSDWENAPKWHPPNPPPPPEPMNQSWMESLRLGHTDGLGGQVDLIHDVLLKADKYYGVWGNWNMTGSLAGEIPPDSVRRYIQSLNKGGPLYMSIFKPNYMSNNFYSDRYFIRGLTLGLMDSGGSPMYLDKNMPPDDPQGLFNIYKAYTATGSGAVHERDISSKVGKVFDNYRENGQKINGIADHKSGEECGLCLWDNSQSIVFYNTESNSFIRTPTSWLIHGRIKWDDAILESSQGARQQASVVNKTFSEGEWQILKPYSDSCQCFYPGYLVYTISSSGYTYFWKIKEKEGAMVLALTNDIYEACLIDFHYPGRGGKRKSKKSKKKNKRKNNRKKSKQVNKNI